MALVACKECGREVSDQAGACPHCGVSIRKSKRVLLKAAGAVLMVAGAIGYAGFGFGHTWPTLLLVGGFLVFVAGRMFDC